MTVRSVSAFAVALILLLAPVFIQAATMPDRIVPCDGVDCNLCHLAQLAQNLLNTGIFVAVFLSAILFAYAGWLYLSNQAVGEVERAKKIFLDVVLGLVLVLGAWILVDTLMKALLGGSFLPWNNICG